MLSSIKRYYRCFCRALAFARIGWGNHDWDYDYLNQLVLFKLKRLEYEFTHYANHSEECQNYEPKRKSLALAIKLLDRLCKNEYSKFMDLHEKKWGPIKYVFEKVEGSEGSFLTAVADKADTPEKKKQQRKEYNEAYDADERQRVRDTKLAYAIIGKYSHYWWD
jgi:hypothetical protein